MVFIVKAHNKTTETLANRFSKHKYDILKRPSNSELTLHFYNNQDMKKDLEFLILEKDIKSSLELAFKEDEWVCRVET